MMDIKTVDCSNCIFCKIPDYVKDYCYCNLYGELKIMSKGTCKHHKTKGGVSA